MAAALILVFLFGMTLLGFVVVVVETGWVVALVGTIHVVASGVLMVLVVRQLSRDQDDGG